MNNLIEMKTRKNYYNEVKKEDMRGLVYLADLGIQKGSIQGGIRPVIIVSNEMGNANAPILTIVPMTTRTKNNLPVHIHLDMNTEDYLEKPSTALVEQIQPINKTQLLKLLGKVSEVKMKEINVAIQIQNALPKETDKFDKVLAYNMLANIIELKSKIKRYGTIEFNGILNNAIANFKNYCLLSNKNFTEIQEQFIAERSQMKQALTH